MTIKEMAEIAWYILVFVVFSGLAVMFAAGFTCLVLYAFYQAREEVAKLRLRADREGWGKYL